ncbi:hypothetical protein C4573_01500 [Candidatus Woesearchaeota archaeon]|nr:MAG: hypothetical protein C4573_01500 [Candidatus Woesearchaeota archaeon]
MKAFLRGVKKGFRMFAEGISSLINTALLSVVYLAGVGITSMVARIMKKEFLDIKRKKSYWKPFKMAKSKDAYYRQV